MQVYLAGPLFTPYVRGFLDDLAARLRADGLEVFVPHEQLLTGPLTPTQVYRTDVAGLLGSQAVLAILDGAEVDDGTACEIGMFAAAMAKDATKRGIVGLVTDVRLLRGTDGTPRLNLFVHGCVEAVGEVVTEVDAAVARLLAWAGSSAQDADVVAADTRDADVGNASLRDAATGDG